MIPEEPLLRLTTWNVQRSSPARARRQVTWLSEHEAADVLVLTEVANSPGGTALVNALSDRGFDVVVPAAAHKDYFVVLAARGALTPFAAPCLDRFPNRCVAAVATVRSRQLGVIGVYVPSRGPRLRRNEDKRAFQNALTERLPSILKVVSDLPVVLAGDLNVVEPHHVPHLPVFGTWEYAFYEQFSRDCGLVDAFRVLNPQAVEHSWYGRSGTGYRLDHIFVGCEHAWRLRSCGYLQPPRLTGLSDHAPMAVSLHLGP